MLDDLDIKQVRGRMLFDSGGNPAVEAEVILENGAQGRALISVDEKDGENEACLVREWLSEAILFEDASDQANIDQLLLEANKTRKAFDREDGKAGVLALSMAVARAAGAGIGLPLYRYLGGTSSPVMPLPVMSVIDGSDCIKGIDFKEIMIIPRTQSSFAEGLRMGTEIYQSLKRLLYLSGYETTIGKSGGFVADVKNTEEALHYIMDAVRLAGYDKKSEVSAVISVDPDHLYAKEEGVYRFQKESKKNGILIHRNKKDMINYYLRLADGFPLGMLFDGLWEEDLEGRGRMLEMLKHRMLIVSDDFCMSNGIEIKLKRAGTVTGAIQMVEEAKKQGLKVIFSTDDRETEEAFLADLSVALGADYINGGAPCRGEYTAKYNELLRIEEFYLKHH